jgi:hypothetical protein
LHDGDWVESCSALVEHFDGRLELINWIEQWALDPFRVSESTDHDVEEGEIPVLAGANR